MVARAMPFIGDDHPKLDTIERLGHGLVHHLLSAPVPALFLVA